MTATEAISRICTKTECSLSAYRRFCLQHYHCQKRWRWGPQSNSHTRTAEHMSSVYVLFWIQRSQKPSVMAYASPMQHLPISLRLTLLPCSCALSPITIQCVSFLQHPIANILSRPSAWRHYSTLFRSNARNAAFTYTHALAPATNGYKHRQTRWKCTKALIILRASVFLY